MFKKLVFLSLLVGFFIATTYLDTARGEEVVKVDKIDKLDIDYDDKDAKAESGDVGEDKQVVGNTIRTLIRRLREITRRGLFQNTILRGTMQCIQTWTGCTLDSAMGATGGGSSSYSSSSNAPNISTCIRQMSDCTRDAANNSPIGTLLQPLPPATASGRR